MISGKIIFLKNIMLMKALCVSFSEKIVIEHSHFPSVSQACCGGSTSQHFSSIAKVKQTLRKSIHFALYDFLLYHSSYQFNAISLDSSK